MPGIPLVGGIIGKLKHKFDCGDLIDRINYQYTPMMIFIAAMSLFGGLYFGRPIQCWVPAQFTKPWEDYAETYCYAKNTYYLPLDQYFPKRYEHRTQREIGYYQWVPLCLTLQAVLFLIPSILWKILNWQSGLSVKGILTAAASVKKNIDSKKREEQVQTAAVHIMQSLDMQLKLKPAGRFCGALFYGSHYGNYVTGLYIFTKLLYVANVVVQFLILNAFLDSSYKLWGFEILRDLINGRQWEESGHFPRVTMCDFQIRVLGNLHRWTVQCVLMINMFNEKIYIFFWFWFLFVGALNLLSGLYWLLASVIPGSRRAFIEKYLRVMGCIQRHPDSQETKDVEKFVNHRLRSDGVFLTRMIQGNGGDLLTGDLVKAMWDIWKENEETKHGEFVESPDAVPPKT